MKQTGPWGISAFVWKHSASLHKSLPKPIYYPKDERSSKIMLKVILTLIRGALSDILNTLLRKLYPAPA